MLHPAGGSSSHRLRTAAGQVIATMGNLQVQDTAGTLSACCRRQPFEASEHCTRRLSSCLCTGCRNMSRETVMTRSRRHAPHKATQSKWIFQQSELALAAKLLLGPGCPCKQLSESTRTLTVQSLTDGREQWMLPHDAMDLRWVLEQPKLHRGQCNAQQCCSHRSP